MRWIPVVRDSILFLVGVGTIIRQLLATTPDPLIIEWGAGMAGIPGIIHARAMVRGTGQPSHSSPESLSSPDQDSPSGM